MGYRRPKLPPDLKILILQFEQAIKSLVRRFRNHPYAFYTETDMHCYLYHRLYAGGTFNGLFRTKDGHDTILLHKEYPTLARYSRRSDRTLVNDLNARKRGRFDICIWDPDFIRGLPHRKQRVLCAAELALNECDAKSVHTLNDATKLVDPSNEVKYGYLLFFVRDEIQYKNNNDKIWKELREASKQLRVVFAHVNGNEKPKPVYLGSWGDV
jgi:hypothetical protein